jgi:hypothetical protein
MFGRLVQITLTINQMSMGKEHILLGCGGIGGPLLGRGVKAREGDLEFTRIVL